MTNTAESNAAKCGTGVGGPTEIALSACPLCGSDELEIVNTSFSDDNGDEDNVNMVECRHCRCSGRVDVWNLRKLDRPMRVLWEAERDSLRNGLEYILGVDGLPDEVYETVIEAVNQGDNSSFHRICLEKGITLKAG